MERNTTSLELRLVPQLLIDQPTIVFGKGVQALLAEWHRFQTAARLLPLQSVQSPDFGMGLNAEQGNRLLRVPSRNNHHACTTGSRDVLQQRYYARIGKCLITLLAKWSQRSVIVEQQQRLWRLRDRFQSVLDMKLRF